MRFLLLAFLLIAVASSNVSSQDIACPETDKKFKIGTSVEEVLGVPDWHACGKIFKIRSRLGYLADTYFDSLF